MAAKSDVRRRLEERRKPTNGRSLSYIELAFNSHSISDQQSEKSGPRQGKKNSSIHKDWVWYDLGTIATNRWGKG